MGKITDIITQKKDPSRVSIFVERQFAFGVSAEIRFIKKLEVGKNLSESQIDRLIEADQVDRLLAKSFKFLSYRPRSEKEIRDYLLRKGKLKDIDKSDVEKEQYEKSISKVIEKLKKIKQIDDKEFARWLFEQRTGSKPRGTRLIKYELFQKGVDKKIVEEVIDRGVVDEEAAATKTALKKFNIYKKLNEHEFKTKMGQYLASKGFDWNTVKKVVDTLPQKEVK